MPNVIVACCGLKCHQCPAFIARRKDDQALRERTAREWSAQFAAEISPEQIACDGCSPEAEVHFAHCFECDIRACALERGLENCSQCDDYACEKLERFFDWVPQARETLDALRGVRDGQG